MLVVDKLTKYAHFIPLGHPYTTRDVVEVFLKEIVKLHGFSSTIVDRDKILLNHFWTELFRAVGMKLKFSFAYSTN